MADAPSLPVGLTAPPLRAGDRWSAIFLIGVALWYGWFLVQPSRLQSLGFNDYPLFIDSLAVLSAAEAAQQGYDVYKPISLDPYHRPHVYPSGWLMLGRIGLTRQDNRWFGPLTLAAFAVALACTVRPRSARQCLEGWLVAGSAGVLLAVVRANNDLWIFALLAALVPIVRARERISRWCGPFVVALGAALKYYPAIAAVLLVAAPNRRDRWVRIGIFAGLMLIVGAGLLADFRRFRYIQPGVDQFLSFGAVVALRQVGVVGASQNLVALACGIAVAIVGGWAVHGSELMTHLNCRKPETLYFVLGAALLGGCFWTEVNWGYRWLFGLWLLPWLWAIDRDSGMHRHPLIRILRYAWWIPLWFEMICVAAKRAMPLSDVAVWTGWWISQAISWIWFALLTAIVASFTARLLVSDAPGE